MSGGVSDVSDRRSRAAGRAGRTVARAAAAWAAGRRARLGEDRGSGAGAVIIFAVLFLTLAAFVVDGGLSISQRERAADLAEQAARYAAMDIDEEELRASDGQNAPINYQNCGDRVQEFARHSDADMKVRCVSASPDQVEVEIQLTYRPVLTGLFYDGPLTVRGRAKAESRTG